MRTSLHHFTQSDGWDLPPDIARNGDGTLLLLFAAARPDAVVAAELQRLIRDFSGSLVMGCSTAGEIVGERLDDAGISAALITFDHTGLRLVVREVSGADQSFSVGTQLARDLEGEGLRAVFTLTDGLLVNGSAYVRGLNQALPAEVVVTGGMAADGERFEHTWVMHDGERRSGQVIACGFYGERVQVMHASRGGWDPLGIDRVVTSSRGNVLYSLDHKPALALYKQYLGDRADGLPGTGLLFPLALHNEEEQDGLTVRTILAVDESEQSITFAGDIPQGAQVRLMRANFDRIIDGAALAGESLNADGVTGPAVCIAISCVGRRLLLGSRIDEELEAVRESLPANIGLLGYYSYGEISPLSSGRCDLHNQTMTLTILAEK